MRSDAAANVCVLHAAAARAAEDIRKNSLRFMQAVSRFAYRLTRTFRCFRAHSRSEKSVRLEGACETRAKNCNCCCCRFAFVVVSAVAPEIGPGFSPDIEPSHQMGFSPWDVGSERRDRRPRRHLFLFLGGARDPLPTSSLRWHSQRRL
jgi:hypothetical protein